MLCKWCGKELHNRKYFCDRDCRMHWSRRNTENKHPFKHTHCQNPECGKELNHWKLTKNCGRMEMRCFPNMKCCDMKCESKRKSLLMKGKKSNFQLFPKKKNSGTKKNIAEFLAFLEDPLQMKETCF